MSEITTTGRKRLALLSGRAHPALAEEIASLLGTELIPTTAYDFASGETFVRFEESVRGVDAFVIQAHPAPVNHWLVEQLLMIDALKRASAKRITVVAPFFPYARQDKKHKGREPISARLMTDLYKAAGANRIISVDLHTPQIQGFFDGPVDHLWALPMLADYVREVVEGIPQRGTPFQHRYRRTPAGTAWMDKEDVKVTPPPDHKRKHIKSSLFEPPGCNRRIHTTRHPNNNAPAPTQGLFPIECGC